MASQLALLAAVGAALLDLVSGRCNYIQTSLDDAAWATDVCIPLDTATSENVYVKYACTGDEASPVLVQTFLERDCSGTPTTEMDLQEALASMARGNASSPDYIPPPTVESHCDAATCFAAYTENCLSADETQKRVRYVPADTCVTNHNDSTSYRVTCTSTSLTYFGYSDALCQTEVNSELILSCRTLETTTGGDESFWFGGCQAPPEPTRAPSFPFPTASPSEAPTPAPSQPPTAFPTFYIPYYGLSPSEIDDYLEDLYGNAAPSPRCAAPAFVAVLSMAVAAWMTA